MTFENYANAFLGKRLDDLSKIIEDQTKSLFEKDNIEISPKSCSTLMVLNQLQSATAAEIAKELNQSHQLVMQKLNLLLKYELVHLQADKMDKRKKNYLLTDKGREQLEVISKLLPMIEQQYEKIYQKLGFNLMSNLDRIAEELEQQALEQRIKA